MNLKNNTSRLAPPVAMVLSMNRWQKVAVMGESTWKCEFARDVIDVGPRKIE